MAKHVYPPWHSNLQKFIFAVAVILCIALPVVYGEHDDDISSTTVIVVLVLYFGLWIAFSIGVRFGIASHTVESTLPIYTSNPVPPVLLHEPAGRDAIPSSPAIKNSSSSSPFLSRSTSFSSVPGRQGNEPISGKLRPPNKSSARFANHPNEQDEGPEDQNGDEGRYAGTRLQQHRQHQFHSTYPPSPTAPPSSPMTIGPPSPTLTRSRQPSAAVHFQTRPRALTGDSAHSSENYPTYATYRQQQHASFDAFAQRIRRALETANAQRHRELAERQQQQQQQQQQQYQEEQHQEQQYEKDQEAVEAHQKESGSNAGTRSGSHLAVPETLAPPPTFSGPLDTKGRPRSSSAASMMSNISEKWRLVGSSTSTFFGRSRAGSDASVKAAVPGQQGRSVTPLSSSISTATANPLPRDFAMSDDKRGSRHSGLLILPHPLAESSHIEHDLSDRDQDKSHYQKYNVDVVETDPVQPLDVKDSLSPVTPSD